MTTQAEHDARTSERAEKINKLLSKAQGASTEEEAGAFFAKAEELMTKWAIDDAMLRHAGKLEDESIEQRKVPVASTFFSADMTLASNVSRSHNVRLLQNKQGRYIILIGFTSDIENVLTLYNLLRIQAVRFSQQHNLTDMAGFDRYVWRRSFRTSFAQRIGERLAEQRRITTHEAEKVHGSGMELVLVDKKKQVDRYYDDLGKGRARMSRQRYSGSGASAGRSAANRADLGNARVGGRRALGR